MLYRSSKWVDFPWQTVSHNQVVLIYCFFADRISVARYGKPHSTYEYAELTDRIREDMAEYDVVVTRDEFNHWLASHDGLLDTLEDAEIDLSCKSDLFDVLDADMSGELEFEEK